LVSAEYAFSSASGSAALRREQSDHVDYLVPVVDDFRLTESVDEFPPLSDLERELLELCSMDVGGGETTTTLDEEMLEVTPGRAVVEATLRGLVARGLMASWRGRYVGTQRNRDGSTVERDYEDNWWPLTEQGRKAIGLPPPRPLEDMPPSVALPDWLRPAVEAVIGDMQSPTPLVLNAKYGPPSGADDFGTVIFSDPGDVCIVEVPEVSRQGSETDVLLALAQELPSYVPELGQSWGQARPVCPGHLHPPSPVERDGTAWWACPRNGALIGRIGTLGSGG
jgi:hypothetical protein